MAKITQTFAANGNGAAWSPAGNATGSANGTLTVTGTFNSGVVTFEARNEGDSTWVTIAGMSFTSATAGDFVTHPGVEYRPVLASSTGTPAIVVSYACHI